MFRKHILSPALAALLAAAPAFAQDETDQSGDQTAGMSAEEQKRADEAADAMIGSVYVREVPSYWTPGEVMNKLRELGYTDIDEFDIEWGYYEFEASDRDGNEVEIEVDPVNGTITSIEDNWF